MRSILKLALMGLVALSSHQMIAQDASKTLLETERMAQRLGLDDKQKAALDKELKAAREERMANMEKMRALREEMRRDAFVERQAHEEKLKEILTDEQWEKVKEQRKHTFARKGRDFKSGKEGARDRVGQNENRRHAMGRRMMMRKHFQNPKGKEDPKKGDGGK